MDLNFGQQVREEALRLASSGKDANQIAKILFDQDDQGANYGIGILLDNQGQPMETSATLLEYVTTELGRSGKGNYMNSAKLMGDLKAAVLAWQRVPETYWDRFQVALPSDAGTGAVRSALELELMLNANRNQVGIEELGWPAYKAIAKMLRLEWKEFPTNTVMEGDDLLPVYQAGPLNTTGQLCFADAIQARAEAAAKANHPVILDRAYSGFEFSRKLADHSFDDVMRMSYETQLRPFVEAGAPFSLALSPTKALVTFALRPCGFLLVYCPDEERSKAVAQGLNTVMRARGSSFEHSITRALVRAMVNDRDRLEAEHQAALERTAEAENLWQKLVQGTEMEYLFSDQYGGLFRNPPAKDEAAVNIYNQHLYPVFTKGRCRLNVTGIPADEALAKQHVAAFAEQCY